MSEVDKAEKHFSSFGIGCDIGYVYLIMAENGLTKIGKTKNITQRIHTIKTSSPEKIEVYRVYKSTDYHKLEKVLHMTFKDNRVLGEWFNLSEDDFEYIDLRSGDHFCEQCFL